MKKHVLYKTKQKNNNQPKVLKIKLVLLTQQLHQIQKSPAK